MSETKSSKFNRFVKRYLIDAFSGMTLGFFCTLIVGLIIEQFGKLCGSSNAIGSALIQAGKLAQILMGAGIGVGIAHRLEATKLVIFACAAAGFLGAQNAQISTDVIQLTKPGDPVSAYLCAVIACEIATWFNGKIWGLELLILPIICILSALVIAVFIGPFVSKFLTWIGDLLKLATDGQPFLMGLLMGAAFGLLLTLPTSSAAIGIMIFSGTPSLAAAAATAGCGAQMVGFAVTSFKENRWAGLISQGLGTSMLQIPNLVKNPRILIAPTIASAISGAFASGIFGLLCNGSGSGMGTSGLVGVLMTISESSGNVSNVILWLGIITCFLLIPIAVSLAVDAFMRKKGYVKDGDMKIEN